MRVSDYELFSVPPRWLFLKLTTSDGTIGWGEPIIEGRTRTVRAAVSDLVEEYVLGSDPTEIERLWQRCYRGGHYRGGPVLMSALAGIDQALWDIKGRLFDAPVYELLGGRARNRVRVYQWIGGEEPADLFDAAERAVDNGYTVLKMMISARAHSREGTKLVRIAEKRLQSVRNAVGEPVEVAFDCRGRISPSQITRLASVLEEYDVLFLEEPVLPEQNQSLSRIAPTLAIPIAVGQRMFSRWDFKEVIGDDSVGFVQPDIAHAGGISEVKKIATMAEAHDVTIAPKSAVGPISLAACLQVDFSTPNATLQEQSINVHDTADNEAMEYLSDPSVFEYEDGFLSPPSDPGLGIDVDESYVREQSEKEIRWQSPTWHNEDGSVAEW